MNQKQGSMEAEKSIHDDDDICPLVEDLPDDSDWDTRNGKAACFGLEYNGVFKIYAVNPNDCSCYHLVDFPFPDGLENSLLGRHSLIASCTMIGSRLYLLGRTNPKQHLSTELWIWDVSQAQKMKHRGERYEWKRGPRLNSAKDKVLAFSLGRDLYALDIFRSFFPQRNPSGPPDPFEDEDGYDDIEEVRAKNPHDFECLKTSLNPKDPLPPWVPMPPLLLEKYVCPFFRGHCCVGDTKFILHIVEVTDIPENHFFCFDVTTKVWVHHLFSGLPFTSYDVQPHPYRHLCMQYFAQVQNHGLFVHRATGLVSVFDFSAVFELLRDPAVYHDPDYEYPSYPLNRDNSHVLRCIEDLMPEIILTWHTFHLGDNRFCCLAFFVDEQQCLKVWICTLDLEKKSKRRGSRSRKKNRRTTTFSASNDVEKIWRIGSSLNFPQLY